MDIKYTLHFDLRLVKSLFALRLHKRWAGRREVGMEVHGGGWGAKGGQSNHLDTDNNVVPSVRDIN